MLCRSLNECIVCLHCWIQRSASRSAASSLPLNTIYRIQSSLNSLLVILLIISPTAAHESIKIDRMNHFRAPPPQHHRQSMHVQHRQVVRRPIKNHQHFVTKLIRNQLQARNPLASRYLLLELLQPDTVHLLTQLEQEVEELRKSAGCVELAEQLC